MTWIDGSRWDPVRGRALINLLIANFPSNNDLLYVIDEVDLDRGALPAEGRTEVRWLDLARTMHERRRLRRAADLLAHKFPALAAQITELSADPPEAVDGNPEDIYEVLLLFGRRPVIDRSDLRSFLRQFLEGRYPLLVIRGEPRTGKTFSLELLKHVLKDQPNLDQIDVDFAPVINGNSAYTLLVKICRLAEVEGVAPPVPGLTTPTAQAIAMVDEFIGKYRNKYTDRGNRNRLLVIDGLNRKDLQDDVHDTVAYLAVQVIKDRLPRTQLVLTGYGGPLDPDLNYGFLMEDVNPITDAHVRLFFEQLILPEQLPMTRIDELVQEALAGDRDVGAIGNRVRKLTLDLLGAP
jgi:hypothetical protein